MAYDERLAGRIRDVLAGQSGAVERKMFGGVGFMVYGNMACGVREDGLIVRVGPDAYEEAMNAPHTRPFDRTGRPMTGWVVVEPAGYEPDDELRAWVERGVDFALTLPAK